MTAQRCSVISSFTTIAISTLQEEMITAYLLPQKCPHMGHYPAQQFHEVHELIFKDGRLLSATERTGRISRCDRGSTVGTRSLRQD